MQRTKIAIVGVGAMGSVYAAFLSKAGHEVWAVDTNQEHLDAIDRSGLVVSGPAGTFVVDVPNVASSPDEVGQCDLWVVATKAHDVASVTAHIAPLLRPDDIVMAFQNGIGAGERVACQVPEDHIVLGIAEGFGSSVREPGQVQHAAMRLIRIGEMRGGLTERVEALARMWRAAGFPVSAFADVDLMIWEKFLCNVTLSAPCAVFDVTIGELMANPEAWGVAINCMLEAHRVGVARGIAFSFEDPVRYVTEFSATLTDASPSMRLDHLAGQRSEVDVINGAVVEMSRDLGLTAPYNETLCAVLRQRESRFGV
jgi:2-dehydropantoate 2-reductase